MPKKQSFLDEPLIDNGKRHLRIVITDSNEQNEFLTVAVDTLRSSIQDTSCIIEPGEHSFIKARSFVNYHYAKVLNYAQIFNGLQKGVLVRKEDISEELLKRIQDGARKTNRFNNNLKIWFELF